MHGDEQKWVDEAIQTNWVSTVGANINEIERMVAEKTGRKYAVALSSSTAALHLAVKLCGDFLCRWMWKDGEFKEEPSQEFGVAGHNSRRCAAAPLTRLRLMAIR